MTNDTEIDSEKLGGSPFTEKQWEEYLLSRFCKERECQADWRTKRECSTNYLAIDEIRQEVGNLVSLASDRKLKIRVYPAGGSSASKEEFKRTSAFDRRLQNILALRGFERAFHRALEDAAVYGEGFLKEHLVASESGLLKFDIFWIDCQRIWLDRRSRESDLSDARYLFYVREMDLPTARQAYPKHEELLESMRSDNERREPVIHMGEAYIRLPKLGEVWRVNFVMDENCQQLRIISVCLMPFAHNMIPFSRITYKISAPDGQAYSPLIRDGGRPAGDELVQPINLAAVDIGEIDKMVVAIMNHFGIQSGGVSELLDRNRSDITGAAPAAKRDESFSNIDTFPLSVDKAVKGLCERLLSSIEQYAGRIQYGAVKGSSGDLQPMEDDGDANITGNRMLCHVEAESASQAMMHEWSYVLAALQQMDPDFLGLFLPMLLKLSSKPGGHKSVRAAVEIIQQPEMAKWIRKILSEADKNEAVKKLIRDTVVKNMAEVKVILLQSQQTGGESGGGSADKIDSEEEVRRIIASLQAEAEKLDPR